MSDRSLRGIRLGAQSLETETGVEPAPRQKTEYVCPLGHIVEVTFSTEAEIPKIWNCTCGKEAKLNNLEELNNENEEKIARTHWDMLLERRSEAELEELLEDRLKILRSSRNIRRSF